MSCQSFPEDEEFEIYLRAWLAYHAAADKVDGHLEYGLPQAVVAGRAAMARVFPGRVMDKNKWQRAKELSLQITERQFGNKAAKPPPRNFELEER